MFMHRRRKQAHRRQAKYADTNRKITVKLASCKSALNPPVGYSTDRSKAVVPVLVLLFVALWFILRGDLLYVFPCVILSCVFQSF